MSRRGGAAAGGPEARCVSAEEAAAEAERVRIAEEAAAEAERVRLAEEAAAEAERAPRRGGRCRGRACASR